MPINLPVLDVARSSSRASTARAAINCNSLSVTSASIGPFTAMLVARVGLHSDIVTIADEYLARLDAQLRKSQQMSNLALLGTGHRLVVVSLLLAAKYSLDVPPNNAYWAALTGITLKELGALELEVLQRLNYNLYVDLSAITTRSLPLVFHPNPIPISPAPPALSPVFSLSLGSPEPDLDPALLIDARSRLPSAVVPLSRKRRAHLPSNSLPWFPDAPASSSPRPMKRQRPLSRT